VRVLVLASHFPKPGNPAMGRWALDQAQALRRAGLELHVVAPTSWVPRALAGVERLGGARAWASAPAVHEWDGLEVRYPRWPLYHRGPHHRLDVAAPQAQLALAAPFLRRRLDAAVRAFRPEVVYAQASAVNGHLAAGLRERHGLPYVVTEHDFDEIRAAARHRLRRAHYRRAMGGATTVIAVATRMEREIAELFPGVPVRTVHNGADLPVATPTDRATADPAGASATDPSGAPATILSVAGFFERKALPLLVEAFSRVVPSHPGAVLRIAGDGRERPAIERAIAVHGAADRITLLGSIPHDEVLREMRAADLFALVGWDEPFATVYLEAMAAGTPVVCCSDGGITDVVRDGVHGRVVAPRDVEAAAAALDDLLADPDGRRRMGEAGRRLIAENLTWDRHAAEMAEVLRRAASGSAASMRG
jgi:glycosyltransferase involved in cell wall biosynthesis